MPRTASKAAQAASTATKPTAGTNDTQKAAKAAETHSQWRITVDTNPTYCGVGACGVHFAHGEGVTDSARAAAWFAEHRGYTVEQL